MGNCCKSSTHISLLDPIKIGAIDCSNRVIMAAMTRSRCDPKTGIPNDLVAKYYS